MRRHINERACDTYRVEYVAQRNYDAITKIGKVNLNCFAVFCPVIEFVILSSRSTKANAYVMIHSNILSTFGVRRIEFACQNDNIY